MPGSRRLAFCGPLLTAALALTGCHFRDSREYNVLVIGDPAAPFIARGRLPLAGQLVRAATAEGLVTLDAQGRISPALADRWIVTDDGESYIFRLRDGTWPDGSAISGESARAALHQAIADLQHAPLSTDLGAIDDVRAMAGRVLEIRLTQPMPDFLQLLAQPELGLVHRGRGAGPMVVKRAGTVAALTPIPPEKQGLAAVPGWADSVHGLRLSAVPGEQAVAAFADGRADVVLGGTFDDLPRTSQSALAKGKPRFDPVSGLFGLAVTHIGGLLSDAALREAIAMAIDRDALAAAIALPGWVPTTRVVSPGTADDSGQVDERWTGVTLADRRATAAARIAAWTKQARQPAVLRIALPAGPGADILFARLTQDLAAISVGAVRVAATAPADLRLVDTVARYPRVAWFLDQFNCAAEQSACSPAADAMVARARAAPERGERRRPLRPGGSDDDPG